MFYHIDGLKVKTQKNYVLIYISKLNLVLKYILHKIFDLNTDGSIDTRIYDITLHLVGASGYGKSSCVLLMKKYLICELRT